MDVVRTSIRIGAKRQSLLCCLPYREDGGPRYSVTAWQGGYAKDEALRSAELTRSAFGVAEEKDQVGGRWLGAQCPSQWGWGGTRWTTRCRARMRRPSALRSWGAAGAAGQLCAGGSGAVLLL